MNNHCVRSFGNNKILAIKLVRELTGLGLKQAKELVERQGGFSLAVDASVRARIANEARQVGIVFTPPLDGSAPPAAPGRGWAVHYRGGPRKIAAIKLIRELSGLGLMDAKRIADDGGVVCTGLGQGDAVAIAARFAALDSQVELVGQAGTASSSSAGLGHGNRDSDSDSFQDEDDF